MRKGLYDRALKDLNEAIRWHPGLDDAFSKRGFVFAFKHRFDRAVEDFDEAIRLNPRKAGNFLGRGFSLEQLGRKELALRDFKKAYSLGLRHPSLLQKLKEYGAGPE